MHPLCIWTYNVNVGPLVAGVPPGGMAPRLVITPKTTDLGSGKARRDHEREWHHSKGVRELLRSAKVPVFETLKTLKTAFFLP